MATSLLYTVIQTGNTVSWRNTGGDELFTPTSLGSGAGRQGALHDFTTAAVGRTFEFRGWIKPGATRVEKEAVAMILKSSDGTHADNDDGTGDIAVSNINKLLNVRRIGQILIDENAAVEMVFSRIITLGHRHAGPIFWNYTANTLSTTATDYGVDMTPVVLEAQ